MGGGGPRERAGVGAGAGTEGNRASRRKWGTRGGSGLLGACAWPSGLSWAQGPGGSPELLLWCLRERGCGPDLHHPRGTGCGPAGAWAPRASSTFKAGAPLLALLAPLCSWMFSGALS